ncbi:MAG: Lon protease, partial [Bifidobacterium angulatum]|nr:Lon protease [Bifidobacterium angulatum]
PSGLRDVAVSTIDDAYDAVVAIGKGKGASLPHCTVDTDVEKTK